MSRRQQYWQDLFIIRSATGSLNRRMSFLAAHEWVAAYMDDIQPDTTSGPLYSAATTTWYTTGT